MKIYLIFILFLFSCSQNVSDQQKDKNTQNTFYDKAFEFREKQNADSALTNFYKAKDLFLKQKDSLGIGKCLVNIGIILTEKGDYFGAQETSLDATNYLNKHVSSHYEYIKSNYNNLGIAFLNLKDYNNALKFYDLAIKFSDNDLDTRIYLNNKAKALQETKDYVGALNIYNKIYKEVSKNEREYSRTLTNLAETKWLQNPTYNPIPEFKKALKIRIADNDLWGQNSSYAHIADYYSKNQKTDSALVFAKKMYEVAKEIKSPDDQLEALEKLVITGDSKKYFLIYQKLNDSIDISRSRAKNQFALIRYDVEKGKAENETLKAVTTQKQNQILILGIVVLALIIIIVWYRRRQKRLQQEKEIEVKNTELKYSKKVHDKVANKVYHVMSEVENTSNVDKGELLDKLETIYHISRDISYEDKEIALEKNFSLQLSKMLTSYSSDHVKVITIGNEDALWQDVMHSSKVEIFYILQELMTNMKKHSHADRTIIKFHRENSRITVLYSDNGIGIQAFSPKNGLKNTETRIHSINGTIIFDNEIETGLHITLSFPTQN